MDENAVNRRNVLSTAGAVGLVTLVGASTAQAQGPGQQEDRAVSPSISGTPTVRTEEDAEKAMEAAKQLPKMAGEAPRNKEAHAGFRFVYGNCLHLGPAGLNWWWWSNHDSSSLCGSSTQWHAGKNRVVDYGYVLTCDDGCPAYWIKLRV